MMSIEIKWFPPSWFQLKTRTKVIYIDPAYLKKYYTNYPQKVEFSTWPDPVDGLPEKDLEKADVILVTHHHKDHCKGVTLNRLKKRDTSVIATQRCTKELGKDIIVIKAGEEIEVDKIKIKTVEAYNKKQGNKTKIAHKKGIGVGYVLSIEGKSIYHAGDTDLIPEMEDITNIDVALLPIGDRDFTMNVVEAVLAVKKINPKVAIPMHRFEANPQEFKEKVEKTASCKVVPLKIGESYEI